MKGASAVQTAAAPAAKSTGSVALQRQCACGQHTVSGEECQGCRAAKATLHRRGNGDSGSGFIPPVVDEVLRSAGEPLPFGARELMESRFHHDFSGVRVHADSQAAESATAVDARAWTVGNHIAFQRGHYNPSSYDGRKLLAHELTHVAQNQQSLRAPGSVGFVSHPHDLAEREASDAATRVMSGGSVAVTQAPGAVMHRDAASDRNLGIGIGVGIAGAMGLGFGIAALAGAFSSHNSAGGTVPDLPDDLVQRLQPACTPTATPAVRQAAIDALVAWARGQTSIGVDWGRVDWVHYDTAADAAGSSTNADDTQHIQIKLGPVAFSSVANLYSTFRHELVHTQEHETRPRSEILSRGGGVQEVYAYLWEIEHRHETGLDRRENWGLNPDGTANRAVGLARVVDGLSRSMFGISSTLRENPNAIPQAELQAINRRIACAMIATPREVVSAVFPEAPMQQWQQDCSGGTAAR